MTTNASFKSLAAIRGFISFVAGALCFCILLANAYGAPTALGTQPFVSSSKINALPNVMYILDDSGSMSENYLPDWAGPYQATISGVLTVVTPPHMFFNGAYNGVAYNSATRYRPPVMYTSTGTLDTTTYPSQTGDSAATGGSAMASAAAPNWQAVKVDGYGIQSTATANLEGNAFSYSTVPGEYCDSVQLRNCVVSAAPTGVYTFPASLRWCTTSVLSVDTTANAGTSCQASNIADTPTNAANGVTAYTFPRMPRPHTATITVNAGGTVTGIAVGGQQILSADAVGLTSTDVATAIVLQINACTYGIPALTPSSRCTVVGYSAVADPNIPNEITVTAPAPTAATPAVTGVAATSVAFSNGSVPGSSVLTVITPTVGSYFKGPNRSDCAGASCTYAEEMTNYANWYAYYQTRMQMMKTAASIAFSAVGNNFRVGFYSINNGGGAGNFFINPDTFDGTQKNLWYSTFFNATPFGATPLRNALATIGRMYAGQLNGSQLNGVSVNEPLQYSCQQNFTIMSTDGYWNDTDNPKQIDGTTDIGEQDAGLDRPYYDGGAQNKTVSQTTKTDNQTGINSFVVTSMTQQQQSTTSRLDQTVVTTDTYPYSTQTSTLQTQTTPLNRTDYALVQSTYPLTSTTKQLQESTYLLNSTPRPLQIYINNLTKTTTPLDQKTYQVTVGTQLLTERDYKVTVGTQLLTKKDYNVTVGTQLLTKKDFKVTVGTQLLTRNVYRLTRTTYALQRSTYMLQTSTRQLQQKNDYSTDGGDTWQNTGWFNVNSCTTRTSGPGWKRNTVCRYDTAVVNGGQNSCTTIAADTTSPYNVRQAVSCAYETVPTVAAVGTCNVAAQSAASPYAPAVTCDYAAAPTVLTGRGTCTAHDETGLPSMSGNKVVCAYDAAATTTTNNLGSCTWVVPSPAASAPRTDCSYQAASFQAGQATCTAALVGTATTDSTVWSTGVSCAYDPAPTTTTTNLPNCTWKVPAVAASAPRTDCSYQVVSNQAGQASCTAAPLGTVTTNNTLWGTGVTCSYDTVPTTTTNLPNCTWKVPAPAASAPRTDCSYQVVSNQAGQATCTAAPVGTLTTDTTVWNTGVTCSYDTVPTTTTNLPSCTWAVPAVAASAPKTECS